MSKKDFIFFVLTGFFVTNAILAQVIGGKLIEIPIPIPGLDNYPVASIGVLPWPIVFLTTDLVNEYFGRQGVRRITFLTVALILFSVAVLFCAMQIPAVGFSPVQDPAFNEVFGQSALIILGSITAFMIAQLVDVFVFWFLRHKTGGKMLWLRATGSTAVSQLIDTFVILGIAFYLPGKLSLDEYLVLSGTNYTYKLLIAIGLTPLIYFAHAAIDKYLGERSARELVQKVASEN